MEFKIFTVDIVNVKSMKETKFIAVSVWCVYLTFPCVVIPFLLEVDLYAEVEQEYNNILLLENFNKVGTRKCF